MAQLSKKIELYAAANGVTTVNFETEVLLQDDGDGVVYIHEWNIDGLAEPTAEQIASYETAGNTAETLQGVLNTRRAEYPELREQLDLLYKDLVAGKVDATGEWAKKIKKVKDDNPK